MKKTLILAGLSCGLAGVLGGCESSPSSTMSNPAEGTDVAGRVGLAQAVVQVVDANGDSVAADSVKDGGFTLHLPPHTRFPVLLDVDSAGVHLKTILPGPDAPRIEIKITPLTDSAARALMGPAHRPGPIGPKEWKDKLDSLRPVLPDSLRPHRLHPVPDSLRPHPIDSLHVHPYPPFPDSLRPHPVDSLHVHPYPPFPDSLRPHPVDSLHVHPYPPFPDSLRPHPVDSLHVHPYPPFPDSLRPVPPAPPVDSLHPHPHHPAVDSLPSAS